MMKKIILYSMMLATLLLFVGCEPIVKETDMGEIITDVSQINATITPLLKDGKVSNKLVVTCKSPVLCQWSADGGKAFIQNDGIMSLSKPGLQTVTLTARGANGKMFTKTFPAINVEVMEEPAWGYLFGDAGVKEWTWNTTWVVPGSEAVAGVDVGPLILMPAPLASVTDFTAFMALQMGVYDPDEGTGAKMKFTLNGTTVAKYRPDATEIENGTVQLELTPTGITGSLGTITFENTNILYPYDMLMALFGGAAAPLTTNTFPICYLDENHMILYADCAYWGWYFVFEAL